MIKTDDRANNGDALPQTIAASARWLIAPALLSAAAAACWRAWLMVSADVTAGSGLARFGESLPLLLLAAAIAVFTSRLVQRLAARRLKSATPKLTRQLIGLVVWTVTCGVLAGSILDVPLGSLVTTSGMMVAVVGIALKNMISDLFTGLSLPLKIGDWIEVDGTLGRVVEVSWRATRLVTRDRVSVIIPNTHLMSKPFRNLSQPEPYYRERFRITLPASVTAYQAERNLVAAARQVDALAAMPFPPDVRITGFNDRGVEWELRYFVPDAEQASRLRYRVQRNLLRNLHYSGIALPATAIELRKAPPAPARHLGCEEQIFLANVDLFGTLTGDELSVLCTHMTRQLARSGIPVVHQGAAGDSLFIVKEGLLSVAINAEGIDTVVGQVAPGQFFGEMSLLTGAPRSATVIPLVDSMVYEITRDVLRPLMQSRPELAQQMSEVLAERQIANAPKLAARGTVEEARESLAKQLFGRISTFFRLNTAPLAGGLAAGAS